MFRADKTRMIGLPCGEKNYDDMLSRFHLIPERYGRTDRQTDGRTDGQNCYSNIGRHYSDIILTRDKYHPIFIKLCRREHVLNVMDRQTHRRTDADGRTHNIKQTDLLYQYRVSDTIFNDRERPVTHIQCYANNQR